MTEQTNPQAMTPEEQTLENLVDRIWRRAYLETPERHRALVKEFVESQCAPLREEIERLRGEKSVVRQVTVQYEAGNIIINTIDGPVGYKMSDFINQPIEGILYDLNRDEATVTAFMDDPKWVNDLAVCKVIRALHAELQLYRNPSK